MLFKVAFTFDVYVAHLDNKKNVHLCILTVSMASPNWIAVSKQLESGNAKLAQSLL